MRSSERLRKEAVMVAEIYGAPKGATPLQQAEALLKGLKMSGATKRQIAQGEAIVRQIAQAVKIKEAQS